MENTKQIYEIYKRWDVAPAAYRYYLYMAEVDEEGAVTRKPMTMSSDGWHLLASGNLPWAKRNAKYFGIKINADNE